MEEQEYDVLVIGGGATGAGKLSYHNVTQKYPTNTLLPQGLRLTLLSVAFAWRALSAKTSLLGHLHVQRN
jgi:succinate dehydrogenase/fumarate reductase flavoprotein subunit